MNTGVGIFLRAMCLLFAMYLAADIVHGESFRPIAATVVGILVGVYVFTGEHR